MGKNSTTSTSIELPKYDLVKNIQNDVDRAWSSGRKVFSYRVPDNEKDLLAIHLLVSASVNSEVELISEKHVSILGKIRTEFGIKTEKIIGSFWEQSNFNINKGLTGCRIVVIVDPTMLQKEEAIRITSGNSLSPCVILIE